MNKKQIAGLVAASLLFVFVCGSSVLVNYVTGIAQPAKKVSSSFWSMMEEAGDFSLPADPFIGMVQVQGTILDTGSASVFSTAPSYDHQQTLQLIDAYADSEENRGILLYVDSPGGGVYESDELYLRLLDYKERTDRPVWTYVASQGCSGGYYIAMATDKVCANRNAWVGSIGVIISMSNYKELFDKLGVKSELITSGPNKAMGSPGIEMTPEQRSILQGLVDESYEQFVQIVSAGREMPVNLVKPLADGRIYTALQALELALIDEVMTYEEVREAMQLEVAPEAYFFAPNMEMRTLNSLFAAAREMQPRSDLEIAEEFLTSQGNGVPMYYANGSIG